MLISAYHGLLVLDKPRGLTSRDAVDRAQRWFPRGTKLGHTGTLDPLATGVLVLCVGAATRLAEYVQQMRKVYTTTIALNCRSTTDDTDGEVETLDFPPPHPDRAAIERCLQTFLGEIEQVPPAYSAAKVSGRRAYDLARKGEAVELAPRRVCVHGIDVLAYAWPMLELRVHCGKGTYIRSLARDLGTSLGRAGLVEVLRRERVGPFTHAEALSLDADPTTVRGRLLPLEAAIAELPRLEVTAAAATALRHGKSIPLPRASCPAAAEEVAAFDEANRLVAICKTVPPAGQLRPEKVMPQLESASQLRG